jgi:hypothetical protein
VGRPQVARTVDRVVTLNPERDSIVKAVAESIHNVRSAHKPPDNDVETHRDRKGIPSIEMNFKPWGEDEEIYKSLSRSHDLSCVYP